MYWKRQPIVDENILLKILSQNIDNKLNKLDILKKCQSVTNINYCSYIHKNGKNKGLICGTISKSKNGRCYTHSRKKTICKKNLKIDEENNNEDRKKELKIIVGKNGYLNKKIIINKELNNIKKLKLLHDIQISILFYNNIILFKNNNFFKFKTLFIFPKYIYDIIVQIIFDVYKINVKNTILTISNVEKNQQSIDPDSVIMTKKCKKSKKNKKKSKKIIKLNKNVELDVIIKKIEETLNTFEEKSDDNGVHVTLNILFKENKKLFKSYINIILSNVNMFFKDVNKDVLLKIWENNVEYIDYERVLIYSDNNHENIIQKVFSYVRCSYEAVPKDVKILWINFDKNSVVPFYKKYNIDCNKSGIKIYDIKDIKKCNQLPIDKITVLYY